jgi:hypothetical protein
MSMINTFGLNLLAKLVVMLLSQVERERALQYVDEMIDKTTELCLESDNKIDDAIIIPLLEKVRETFDIPD